MYTQLDSSKSINKIQMLNKILRIHFSSQHLNEKKISLSIIYSKMWEMFEKFINFTEKMVKIWKCVEYPNNTSNVTTVEKVMTKKNVKRTVTQRKWNHLNSNYLK